MRSFYVCRRRGCTVLYVWLSLSHFMVMAPRLPVILCITETLALRRSCLLIIGLVGAISATVAQPLAACPVVVNYLPLGKNRPGAAGTSFQCRGRRSGAAHAAESACHEAALQTTGDETAQTGRLYSAALAQAKWPALRCTAADAGAFPAPLTPRSARIRCGRPKRLPAPWMSTARRWRRPARGRIRGCGTQTAPP